MSEENVDWSQATKASERFVPQGRKREPVYDEEVSKIVGKPVSASDPRLLKVVVKHKNDNGLSGEDVNSRDDHLHNPKFVKDLKDAFK